MDIFSSDALRVFSRLGFEENCIVVTFDSYTDKRGLNRQGFAQSFLESRKIDAIHFVARDNDWYQYPELLEAAAAVGKITSRYRRVVAYGSSMGGYAAIRFGTMVGAKIAIALSPQYSIDPMIVPFETRWAADAARIAFIFDEKRPCPFTDTSIVFFDPYNLDSRHVQMYRGDTTLHGIRVPNGGHPCGGFLSETGILQEAVVQIAHGDLNYDEIQREIRKRRKSSAQLFFTLSRRAKKLEQQILFVERALDLSQNAPGYLSEYGNVLARAGRFKQAEAMHKKALVLAPGHPVFLYHLSECYERGGEFEKAFDVMGELMREPTTCLLYRARTDHLVQQLREKDRAAAASSLPFDEHTLDTPPRSSALDRLARLSLTRPLVPLLRRLRLTNRGKALSEPTISRTRAENFDNQSADIIVTTLSAPPPFISSWRRHRQIVDDLPAGQFDLLLLGDSLVEFWPNDLWAPLKVYNMGVAADKTQHILWRLDQLPPRRLDPRFILLMAGTNNLGAADTPEGIAAGIEAIARRVRLLTPESKLFVMEILPCGPNFRFRNDCRTEVNIQLRASNLFSTIDAEYDISRGFTQPCPYYHEDQIHISHKGYLKLTSIVRSRFGFGK